MIWKEILAPAFRTTKMQDAKKFIQDARKTKNIYPAGKDVFRAFDLCPFETTNVVILGQDPYHTKDTSDGLAFSTRQSKRPPSLNVIFKELYRDLNIQYYHNETFEEYFPSNSLEKWARNGFLLLNTVLTVEEGKPESHKDIGWDEVIKAVFNAFNQRKKPVIFLLWGKHAQRYKTMIDPSSKHLYFEASHPAAELYNQKAGFYGCRHFSIIRDVIPSLEGRNLFKKLNLNACFDKEKAKQIVKEHYPIEAAKINKYIDEELIINVPVNKDQYWKEVRLFENLMSTK